MKRIFIVTLLSFFILDIFPTDSNIDLNKIDLELNNIIIELQTLNKENNDLNENIKNINNEIKSIKETITPSICNKIISLLGKISSILISILAFIISVISFCFTQKQLKISRDETKNVLFSKIAEEYSSDKMYSSKYDISDFIRVNQCFFDKKSKKEDMIKKLINEYIELEKLKDKDYKLDDKKYKFNWYKLDEQRRYIVNYFIKVFIFYDKQMIPTELFHAFWSKESLSLLIDYIIILDYVAKPLIMKNIDPDDYYQEGKLMLVEYLNKYICIESKIKLDSLKKLYDEIKSKKGNKKK